MFKPERQDEDKRVQDLYTVIGRLMLVIVILVVGIIAIPIVLHYQQSVNVNSALQDSVNATQNKDLTVYWKAPDLNVIGDSALKSQVSYGRDLIAQTANYFGPGGSISKTANGLNCQNCHLDAGTRVWGNNFGSVASLYPKFRPRSGTVESIYKRVNDCFERSLNGKAIDTAGKEMKAIVAYIFYLGSNVEKGKKAEGSGFRDLAYLDRAADPVKGQLVYTTRCLSCHQPDGGGVWDTARSQFLYPALWGKNSYNDAAGLYRIIGFAKYVKYNMPQGTTYDHPQLTDEEAWDVAAFVNSQSRPHMNTPFDWPDITKKPVDHPFGPYADEFSAARHKYGPFAAIEEVQKKNTGMNKPGKK